jgi:hypothetical protein
MWIRDGSTPMLINGDAVNIFVIWVKHPSLGPERLTRGFMEPAYRPRDETKVTQQHKERRACFQTEMSIKWNIRVRTPNYFEYIAGQRRRLSEGRSLVISCTAGAVGFILCATDYQLENLLVVTDLISLYYLTQTTLAIQTQDFRSS